ncbi:MAG: LysM peptidoglycan-binding domain-containing protein [Maricaulaceae bacterium]
MGHRRRILRTGLILPALTVACAVPPAPAPGAQPVTPAPIVVPPPSDALRQHALAYRQSLAPEVRPTPEDSEPVDTMDRRQAEVQDERELCVHTVQTGDTLFRIALDYNLTPRSLARYNKIRNLHRIDVSDRIKIPPTPCHRRLGLAQ